MTNWGIYSGITRVYQLAKSFRATVPSSGNAVFEFDNIAFPTLLHTF